jgi:hypothetical protein
VSSGTRSPRSTSRATRTGSAMSVWPSWTDSRS